MHLKILQQLRNLLYLLFQENLLQLSATEGSSNADQAQITLAVSEDPIVGVQEQITPPTVDTQVPPVADKPEIALDFARHIYDLFLEKGYPIPPNIVDIVNPKDLDKQLNNKLKHKFWKDTKVPVYDKDKPHFSDELLVDPSEPNSYFDFFWPDKDLEK